MLLRSTRPSDSIELFARSEGYLPAPSLQARRASLVSRLAPFIFSHIGRNGERERGRAKVAARMKSRMSLIVIVNRAAARAREAWPRIEEALVSGGVSFESHESVRPGETETRTREALASGAHTVAVVGGDGTLSAAASGYFHTPGDDSDELPRPVNASASLAIIPAGTGDDFARGLSGGLRAPLEVWTRKLVEHCRATEEGRTAFARVRGELDEPYGLDDGCAEVTRCDEPSEERSVECEERVRRVDVAAGRVVGDDGRVRRFVFLNAATLGVGAEVASRVASQAGALRRMSGEARFACAAVQSLAAWRNRNVKVEIDGATWLECRANLIAVVNGPYAGGGMNFAPEADASDGRLEIVTACGLSRARAVRELMRLHSAGHLKNPRVRLSGGARIRVETTDANDSLQVEADGDPRGRTPAEFRVVPAALRIVF